MKIFKSKSDLKKYIALKKEKKKSIGLVPTMGALHQGHLYLVEKALKKNDIAIVSIFVNPTQFDSKEDLDKYPKPLEEDIKLLTTIDCDVLFTPEIKDIYNENVISKKFDFDGLEHQMEGKYRENHFDGVGTIVKTLFEIIEPDTAYFGKKDFQQLQIIKKLINKLNLPVKIKGMPVFREKDGLAMSSRNTRLTKDYRKAASFIYIILKKVRKKNGAKNVNELTKWVEKQFNKHPFLKLEYFTIADEETLRPAESLKPKKRYRAFIAVFAKDIRLIDNMRLKNN